MRGPQAPSLLDAEREDTCADDGARAEHSRFVEHLFERYRRPLLRYVSARVGRPADAEDVLQEAYTRLLGVPELDRTPARARAYLFSRRERACRDCACAGRSRRAGVRRTGRAGAHADRVGPVAVLPGDIVVDVHSIAVLPFDQAREAPESAVDDADERAAARIARQLHDEVMSQLSRIPGLYVVDGSSTAVYASGELAPEQIAALLGVRGVVAAGVELDGRTVRVSLRMTDAASAAWPTEIVLERPLDELPDVKTAIVANIADALDSTSF